MADDANGIIPGENDVLLGRGNGNHHSGNISYRRMVAALFRMYIEFDDIPMDLPPIQRMDARRQQKQRKYAIYHFIIYQIQSSGRFLCRLKYNGRWLWWNAGFDTIFIFVNRSCKSNRVDGLTHGGAAANGRAQGVVESFRAWEQRNSRRVYLELPRLVEPVPVNPGIQGHAPDFEEQQQQPPIDALQGHLDDERQPENLFRDVYPFAPQINQYPMQHRQDGPIPPVDPVPVNTGNELHLLPQDEQDGPIPPVNPMPGAPVIEGHDPVFDYGIDLNALLREDLFPSPNRNDDLDSDPE